LPPASCQAAFNACVNVEERKLFWHDLGHWMPKEAYFREGLSFFEGKVQMIEEEKDVEGEPPINVLLSSTLILRGGF